MRHIVFFGIPAHGHTNPTLGVVRELIHRGHQVTYYSYEIMRSKIEATGACFVPCDPFDAEMKLSPAEAARLGSDLALSTRVLVDSTLALDNALCRRMTVQRPDCIVADSMALWGKAIAMKLRIPFVSSTTTFAFNQHSARIMKQSFKELLGMLVAMPKVKQQIKRLQARDYPIQSALDILQNDNDTHTIVYTSPGFQPSSETFSEKYAFVGPSIRPAEKAFQKTREKLIYISMGTVHNDQLALYRHCIEALQSPDYQVVLSMGQTGDPSLLGPLPANISAHTQVDQIALLHKADAFLTHCGMNSVSEALYFGVPLAMLPQTAEQRGVAERVRQLGAGILLPNGSAIAIQQTLSRLLSDPSYQQQAQRIGQEFRTCSGAKGAADKILSLCQ